MADPLSIVSGAAGVASLGITVCNSLLQYYGSWKDRDSTLNTMYSQLESLGNTFALLERTLNEHNRNIDPAMAIRMRECVESCRGGVLKLEKKLLKVRKTSGLGPIGAFQDAKRRALFPFKESTLVKMKEIVVDLRDDLAIALGVLQM